MTYLAAPIIIPFIKRYSRYRYLMIWVGCKSTLIAFSVLKPTDMPFQGRSVS